jgi:large subunit ribosomal protein L25
MQSQAAPSVLTGAGLQVSCGGRMINITCTAREGTSKGNVRRLRRDGSIPIVVYSKGQTAQKGSVSRAEFEAAMRSIRPGFLTTTVFVLKDQSGRERKVLTKEVQYKSTTYDIIHIDFLELEEGRKIEVKVPVEFDNASECVGVKLGGQLRHIMRHVAVRCVPEGIPSHFSVDVKELGIRQTKRVRDIAFPSSVTCLARADDVVVAVLK